MNDSTYGVQIGQVRLDVSDRFQIKVLDVVTGDGDSEVLVQYKDGSTNWMSAFKISYRYPKVVKESRDV